MPPIRHPLSAGRWHFQHGPIDLVIGADGSAPALDESHAAAWVRFQTVLPELVAELPLLREAVREDCALHGAVARRMWRACAAHRSQFITSMAAVAGAVAEELIAAYRRDGVRRAWVNNGGDIALHLAPGESIRIGVFADVSRGPASELDGRFEVSAAMPVRGVATSGWRGRSLSLGIADSVTVLAATASGADAAATMIANAVNIDDPRIQRCPARWVKDDSDLGDLFVTVQVPPLPAAAVHEALQRGALHARQLRDVGTIWAAALFCQGRALTIGGPGVVQYLLNECAVNAT